MHSSFPFSAALINKQTKKKKQKNNKMSKQNKQNKIKQNKTKQNKTNKANQTCSRRIVRNSALRGGLDG